MFRNHPVKKRKRDYLLPRDHLASPPPRKNSRSDVSDKMSKGQHTSNQGEHRTRYDSSKMHQQQQQVDRRRGPPSTAALDLSSRLKQLSREKKWDEALQMYRDTSHDRIRDGHHACIMVDLAARCGKISEGERIVQELQEQKKFISVELQTALLKGFAHCGDMAKADALFHRMCSSQAKASQPNIRTLNTLLRGCLWSAASVASDGSTIVGGVVTAERAWSAYQNLKRKVQGPTLDVSSFEYSVKLLCQALRTSDAKGRIQELKMTFGRSQNDLSLSESNDQSMTEGLAVAYLALGQAHAILKETKESIDACKLAIAFAVNSKKALKNADSFSRKRGWKQNSGEEDRRSDSNATYRHHRLSEIETEARTIIDICQDIMQDGVFVARDFTRRLITRLVYLSGGGSSEPMYDNHDHISNDQESSKSIQSNMINTLFYSFGLSFMTSKLNICMGSESIHSLKQKECNRMLGAVGLQGGIINDDGSLNLLRIFSAGIGSTRTQKRGKTKTQRLELELGAGFGDWIVQKAVEDPKTNFVALELRADRVAQIFTRTVLLSSITPINNLCVIGGDGRQILSRYLGPGAVDSLYVNHPEPPTQTYGFDSKELLSIIDNGQEPTHMLHSAVLIAAATSLKRSGKGRLVIVTDNRWYARLISATFVKVKKAHPGWLEDVDLTKSDAGFHKVEVPEFDGVDETCRATIFQGQPNATIGYPSKSRSEGNSYFDRLWRAGAGAHAETRARYVIVQRSAVV